MDKILGGHVTLATPTFRKILRCHVQTVPANMLVKFNSFNCNVCNLAFGLQYVNIAASTGRKWTQLESSLDQGGKNSTLKGKNSPRYMGIKIDY